MEIGRYSLLGRVSGAQRGSLYPATGATQLALDPLALIRRLVQQISVRGIAKTNGEWGLVCLAVNLRRMHGMMECE